MKFSQYLTIFPCHLNNIYLKYFGLLQNLNKNNEILQKLMIFHETNEISWNVLVYNFAFVKLRCTLLTFTFAFGTFESWLQNFCLVWTDLKFQNFGHAIGKSLKNQYRSYLLPWKPYKRKCQLMKQQVD